MNTDIVTMKTLILFLLSAVLVFGQAANDQLITQRKPDNSGNIQRNVPMEGAISTTLASYRSALGLGTEDSPQFTRLGLNEAANAYTGIAISSSVTASGGRAYGLDIGVMLNASQIGDSLYGAFVDPDFSTNAFNFLTTYGAYINSSSPSGGGTILNNYGLYIANQNIGATNNYAIYTNGGLVRFGDKTSFTSTSTLAGLNVGSVAGDPSSLSNGDLWYDSTANELTARINGANVALGAAGAVTSVNGQTGVVTLDAADVGAGGLIDPNQWTAQNTFALLPNVPWEAAPASGNALAQGHKYVLDTLNSNYTISSFTGTDNGGVFQLKINNCNGTAQVIFPAAQRMGSTAGTSTALLPTAGAHLISFFYDSITGAWYYQDDVVGFAHAITFSVDGGGAPLTTGVQIPVKTPYGGTVTGYTMMASPSGSITFNVFRAANGGGLPTASIINNAGGGSGSGTLPAISGGVEGASTTLTNWGSTAIAVNDNLALNLTAVDGVVTKCTFVLYFQ